MSFTFGNPVASVAPTMGTTNPVTTASTGFGFGASTFGVPALPRLTATTSVTAASTAAGQLTLGSFTASKPAAQSAANLTTTTQTTQSSSVSGTQLNFCQLEEFINKWTLELEEQEKLFTNQATQVNAWDKLLLGNGEKIVALNEAVEKVKAE
ncbi:nuclear pore glycoprotein p62-like [Toxorhynchites rutilus septentrionalis]|uniref:nuclear pore glycoprotein p62-like n=1 Tax=Toxorhynchites rutilus septentrionalis TaxID=329112 RepID=UPI00247B0CA9|nr:nuclear pore glycoprotein p62-like [Toxorhynchites rutilus septentrionalis]